MNVSVVSGLLEINKKVVLLFVGMVAAVAMLFAVTAPSASAGNFCSYAWVAPYGQGGDRCWGASHYQLNFASVITYERAGCVTIADGSNNLLTSWVCGGAGSNPSNAAQLWLDNYTENRKGVVRNNNVSFGTHITGYNGCLGATC
jgi:hypothetical protein